MCLTPKPSPKNRAGRARREQSCSTSGLIHGCRSASKQSTQPPVPEGPTPSLLRSALPWGGGCEEDPPHLRVSETPEVPAAPSAVTTPAEQHPQPQLAGSSPQPCEQQQAAGSPQQPLCSERNMGCEDSQASKFTQVLKSGTRARAPYKGDAKQPLAASPSRSARLELLFMQPTPAPEHSWLEKKFNSLPSSTLPAQHTQLPPRHPRPHPGGSDGFCRGEQALHSASEHYTRTGHSWHRAAGAVPCWKPGTRQLQGAVSKRSHAAEASGNTAWGGGWGEHSRAPPPTVKRRGQSRVAQSPSSGAKVAFSHLVVEPQNSKALKPCLLWVGCAHGCPEAPYVPPGWHPAAGQGAVAASPGTGGAYPACRVKRSEQSSTEQEGRQPGCWQLRLQACMQIKASPAPQSKQDSDTHRPPVLPAGTDPGRIPQRGGRARPGGTNPSVLGGTAPSAQSWHGHSGFPQAGCRPQPRGFRLPVEKPPGLQADEQQYQPMSAASPTSCSRTEKLSAVTAR